MDSVARHGVGYLPSEDDCGIGVPPWGEWGKLAREEASTGPWFWPMPAPAGVRPEGLAASSRGPTPCVRCRVYKARAGHRPRLGPTRLTVHACVVWPAGGGGNLADLASEFERFEILELMNIQVCDG